MIYISDFFNHWNIHGNIFNMNDVSLGVAILFSNWNIYRKIEIIAMIGNDVFHENVNDDS